MIEKLLRAKLKRSTNQESQQRYNNLLMRVRPIQMMMASKLALGTEISKFKLKKEPMLKSLTWSLNNLLKIKKNNTNVNQIYKLEDL